MARTTTPRRRASKAQREAAQARDAELAAKAAAALADPGIGERIAALIATPGMLRYSLRNQALLMKQADERGMTLTDVETYRGWQRRGRQVRTGERGLKINRPNGRTGEKVDDSGEPTVLNAEKETGEEAETVRFRVMTVFDISQTDEVDDLDDLDDVEEPEQDPEPAATLFESLRGQAERAGYLVTVWPAEEAHTEPVGVDHEAKTVNVYGDDNPQTLSQLAATVAAILTARAKTKATPTERTPDEITLTVV